MNLFKKCFLIPAVLALATVAASAQGPAPVNDTGHGTQIGDRASAGFSGWGATPVVQQPVGTDPYTALQLFGLIAPSTSTTRALGNFTVITGTVSPITAGLVAPFGTLDLVVTSTSSAMYIKLSGTGSAGWGLVTTGTGP